MLGHYIYWLFPTFSAIVWLGTLSGLLGWWTLGVHREHLPSMDPTQYIAYISDTGAFELKPLFIAGSACMVVFLDLGMIAERWLRHTGRLSRNTSRFQKALSTGSIIFAIIGAAGLILLSIFDTYRHPHVHDAMLVVFIAGYVISAILICWEFQRLGIKYRQHRILRASFWLKLTFIVVEVVLAIAFGVCSDKAKYNAAAVLEWCLAFIFSLYIASFIIDLIPAVNKHKHQFDDDLPTAHANGQSNGYANGYANRQTNGQQMTSSHF